MNFDLQTMTLTFISVKAIGALKAQGAMSNLCHVGNQASKMVHELE